MNSLLLLAAMAQLPDTGSAVIFGREQWYRAVRGDEERFSGVLQRIPGTTGDSRCAFTLVTAIDGKNTTRDVFVAGQNQALANFAGRRVRITGMAVDLKVDGRMRYEIWPARLEVVGGGGVVGGDVPIGGGIANVLSATDFNLPVGARAGVVGVGGQIQTAVRSMEELQRVCVTQQNTNNLLTQLNAKDIDFRRFMIVVCSAGMQRSAGYTIEIVNVEQAGLGWRIRWKLHQPRRGEVVNLVATNPSKVLVLPRTDGLIRFEQVR